MGKVCLEMRSLDDVAMVDPTRRKMWFLVDGGWRINRALD